MIAIATSQESAAAEQSMPSSSTSLLISKSKQKLTLISRRSFLNHLWLDFLLLR